MFSKKQYILKDIENKTKFKFDPLKNKRIFYRKKEILEVLRVIKIILGKSFIVFICLFVPKYSVCINVILIMEQQIDIIS